MLLLDEENALIAYKVLSNEFKDLDFNISYKIGNKYFISTDNENLIESYIFPQDCYFSDSDFKDYRKFAIVKIWGTIKSPKDNCFWNGFCCPQIFQSSNIEIINEISREDLFSEDEFFYKLKWFSIYRDFLIKEKESIDLVRLLYPGKPDSVCLVNKDGEILGRFLNISPIKNGFSIVITMDNKWNVVNPSGILLYKKNLDKQMELFDDSNLKQLRDNLMKDLSSSTHQYPLYC